MGFVKQEIQRRREAKTISMMVIKENLGMTA